MTTCMMLFRLDKNLSIKYRKETRKKLHMNIQTPPSYGTRQRDDVILPEKNTFLNAYKILFLSIIPSKTKETTFQILNRTVWTQNKAFKSGRDDSPHCYRCEHVETMEHLLYECEHYSSRVWELLGHALTNALAEHSAHPTPVIIFTFLEIIYNKPHPVLKTHVENATTRTVIILLIQEIKRDIIYRRAQITQPRREPVFPQRIQAHILSSIQKVQSYLEYQGILAYNPGITLLQQLTQHILA